MARNNKTKNSVLTDDFNYTNNHPDLIDIYKRLTPESAEYIFFSHIQSNCNQDRPYHEL